MLGPETDDLASGPAQVRLLLKMRSRWFRVKWELAEVLFQLTVVKVCVDQDEAYLDAFETWQKCV